MSFPFRMAELDVCPNCDAPFTAEQISCDGCGIPTSLAREIARELASGGDTPPASEDESEVATLLGMLRTALEPAYVPIRPIGGGGMGRLFLARDPQLKRFVAVKLPSPALAGKPAARARFVREARAVAAVSHPNVMSIYTISALPDGTPFVVMQYVEGRSFAERLRESGPLSIDEARRALGEVAAALAAAHRRGVIHRDIKPANVLQEHDTGRVVVIDFGIASMLMDADEPSITGSGNMVGTPTYMSPEQILGTECTSAIDVYGFGLLGYELLAGRGPYDISTPREILAAHVRDEPRPLAELRPDTPPQLAALLQQCLSKSPADRPTADELADALSEGVAELLEWPPPGLERLHGALMTTLERLWIGVLLLALALSSEVQFLTHATLEQRIALGALVFIAIYLTVDASVRITRIWSRAIPAEAAGYRLVHILEVVADGRRDGGALIAGVGRYSGVPLRERNRLRTNRLIRLGLMIAGVLAPFLLVLPSYLLLPETWLTTAAPWVVLVATTLAVVELGLQEYERVRVRRSRRTSPKRQRLDQTADIVATWRDTFERVRRGQKLGTAWSFGPVVYRLLQVCWILGLTMWSAAVIVCAIYFLQHVRP